MTREGRWRIHPDASFCTFVGDLVIRSDGIVVVIGPVGYGNVVRACGIWDERQFLSTELISAYGPTVAMRGIVR